MITNFTAQLFLGMLLGLKGLGYVVSLRTEFFQFDTYRRQISIVPIVIKKKQSTSV